LIPVTRQPWRSCIHRARPPQPHPTILPQIVSGNDDGIEIRSSENGNTILRPRLEITYAVTPTGPDLDGDGVVGGSDLAVLLGAWGGSGAADLDGNGVVDGGDLAIVLGSWG